MVSPCAAEEEPQEGSSHCTALKKLELSRVVLSLKNSSTRLFPPVHMHLHLHCRSQSPTPSQCSARTYCCFHRFFSSLLFSFKIKFMEINFVYISEFIVSIRRILILLGHLKSTLTGAQLPFDCWHAFPIVMNPICLQS